MKEKRLVAMALAVVFCVVLTFPGPIRASVVWSYDFNDGNHNEWTVCENPVYSAGSNWSAAEYYLQLDQEDGGIISCSSNSAYGTWSFDFRAIAAHVNALTYATIAFISSNLDGDDWDDWICYWVSLQATSTVEGLGFSLSLHKTFGGVITTIASYTPLLSVTGWHHIDVTRTTAGLFSVYHNGSLILQGEDNDIDTSELFVFYVRDWQMFDNVVVDDEITIYPPPDIVLIVMIVASAVVIVAVVAIILKRR